jgi:hypothetical protein
MGALAQAQAQVAPGEPQSAALTPQAQSGGQLPFHGSIQAVETGQPQSPTTLLVNGTGEGTATHLGRYSVTFTAVVNPQLVGMGNWIFTAANGDRLITTIIGQATPSEPGVLSITENVTITGGTGRFAGATGSFVIERALQTATLVSSGSFTGTITLAH